MQDRGGIKMEFHLREFQLRSMHSVFFHIETPSQILRTELDTFTALLFKQAELRISKSLDEILKQQ